MIDEKKLIDALNELTYLDLKGPKAIDAYDLRNLIAEIVNGIKEGDFNVPAGDAQAVSGLLDRIDSQIGAKMQIVQESLEGNRIVQAIDEIRDARKKLTELCDLFRNLHQEVDNN